ANTPASLPHTTVTPASSAALKEARLERSAAGSGPLPGFQPRYLLIASAAASVGHNTTPRLASRRNTSASPSSPCSMVATPARAARRIPSLVRACAPTGHPAERAVSTICFSSSTENVGLPPFCGFHESA